MKKKLSGSTLLILGLIMVVNALSYGTIIPLLYPYASRFGINAVGLSLLFASYSFFQLVATPIIGRMSDKFGRKPMLILSLLGTSVSLALFASASSVIMLYIARVLDGITGGNISVAQAVIADSTKGKDRARAFGILGAAFGFGFMFGPALGGVLSKVSLTAPFWFSAGLALVGSLMIVLFLPETNKNKRTRSKQSTFDLKKINKVMTSSFVGSILMLNLIASIAHNGLVIGFQSYSVDALHMTPTQIGVLFGFFGLVSVLMQGFGIKMLLNFFGSKKRLIVSSLLFSAVSSLLLFFQHTVVNYVVVNIAYTIAFAPIFVTVAGFISENTKGEDQGGVLGINQSFQSLGQIIGPLFAGLVSTLGSGYIFVMSGFVFLIAFVYGMALNRSAVQRMFGKIDI